MMRRLDLRRGRTLLSCLIATLACVAACKVECPEGTQAVGGACLSPDDLADAGAGSDGGTTNPNPDRDGEVVDGCNGLVCDGECVDPQSDPQHCGGCGQSCNAICEQGACGGVAQVAAGGAHTCVLLRNSTVKCWGMNSSGQLGDGTIEGRHRPTPVPGLTSVVEIAAGAVHTCALLEDGTVRCWGHNDQGQARPSASSDEPILTPTQVPDLGGVTTISAAGNNSCALQENRRVTCWGANDYGQLGTANAPNRRWSFVVGGATRLSVGLYWACALTSDERVHCWGSEGIQEYVQDEFRNVEELSSGMIHICARRTDGTAKCLGDNSDGQLCNGMYIALMSPDRPILSDFRDVTHISAGMWQTCFLTGLGETLCCGRHGAEPDPAKQHAWSITSIPIDGVVELATGGFHTCARRENGEVFCWGENEAGQLGDGTTFARRTPVPVAW